MPNVNAKQSLLKLMDHLDGAYAPNTLRAYRADMLEFIDYCSKQGEQALPACASTVAEFLMSTVQQGIKTSTIRRKASSISAVHRLSCLEDPTKHPEVKITLRKISRQLGSRFDQAYPIRRPLLDKMLAVCGDDLRGLRDRALLLIAYDSMRRRSEIASLRVEDLEWLPDEPGQRRGHGRAGATILLRRSKTDQAGAGKWVHLSAETATAVAQWLDKASLCSGFLLRGVLANDKLTDSLCDSRIARIYKQLARMADLQAQAVRRISGHSMRVGAAQDLLTQGASLPHIMVKGGWSKTDTVMRYVERVRVGAVDGLSAIPRDGVSL